MVSRESHNSADKMVKISKWIYFTLFLLLAAYFRFLGGTWLVHINSYFESSMNLAVLCLIFLYWMGRKYFRLEGFSSIGLEIPLALLLLAIFISTLFSINRGLSLEIAVGITTLFIGSYLLLDIRYNPEMWELLKWTILIVGLLNALIISAGVVDWIRFLDIKALELLNNPLYILKSIPRLPNMQNHNPNVTAAYFLILLPWIIRLTVSAKKMAVKAVLILYAVLAITILFLTKSRGVYLGVGSAFLFILLTQWRYIINIFRKKTVFLVVGIILAVGLISFAVWAVLNLRGTLFGITMLARIEGWRSSWEIIKEYPITGSGLGTFPQLFLEFRNPSEYQGILLHAHNELINCVVQLGGIGLAAIAFLGWKLIILIMNVGVELDPDQQTYLISIAGFAGMGLVDSFLDSSNISILLMICIIGIIPASRIIMRPWNRSIWYVGVFILIALASIDYYALWKLEPYHNVRQAAYDENWPEAEEYINVALRRDPHNLYYQFIQGQIQGQLAWIHGEGEQPSISIYQNAFQQYPGWHMIPLNLAGLMISSGNYLAAEEYLHAAISSNPSNALPYCLLGDVMLADKQEEKSFAAFINCLELEPEWINTAYWLEDPRKVEILPRILEYSEKELAQISPDQILKLAGMLKTLGEIESARNLIESNLNASSHSISMELTVLYHEILIIEGEFRSAEESVELALMKAPLNEILWLQQGEIYFLKGDIEEAFHSFMISSTIIPTPKSFWYASLAALELGDVKVAKDLIESALSSKDKPSQFSYWVARRFPVPGEMLPFLPELMTDGNFFAPARMVILELSKVDCDESRELHMRIFNDDRKWPGCK